MLKFAARAYRRPLSKAERDDILTYYHTLRDKNDLTHEEAVRNSIASILMSPDFCYRIDLWTTARRRIRAREGGSDSGGGIPSACFRTGGGGCENRRRSSRYPATRWRAG